MEAMKFSFLLLVGIEGNATEVHLIWDVRVHVET